MIQLIIKTSRKKIIVLSLVLFFILFLFPATGDNQQTSKNETSNEYFLVAEYKSVIFNNKLNISTDDFVNFRIWDNKSKTFVTTGIIKINNTQKEIESHSISESLKDIIIGGVKEFFGGEGTVGNNSEYYSENRFEEIPEAKNYSWKVVGEYASKPTVNTIITNVETQYITIKVGSSGKPNKLEKSNRLSERIIKYHKKNAQSADNLIKKLHTFLIASDDLNGKINNLTSDSDEVQLKGLEVDKLLDLQKDLENAILCLNEKTKDDKLINEELSGQLNSISEDTNNITHELTGNLNSKKNNLLETQYKEAKALLEKRTNDLSVAKSDFRSEVFYPAGLLVILGFIIGYFNVNRWKKESEYFGLYTSKANIMSPITLALIITIIILILVGGVVYFENSLGMFKFLIL